MLPEAAVTPLPVLEFMVGMVDDLAGVCNGPPSEVSPSEVSDIEIQSKLVLLIAVGVMVHI